MSGETFRRVQLHFDEHMNPQSDSTLSRDACTLRAMGIWPPRAVVPVIFLPGIMGTNLKSKSSGDAAWIPPNKLGEKLSEVSARKQQSPDQRQIQLTPEDCDVYDYQKAITVPETYMALDDKEAKARHWGELHAESYLQFLLTLENALNFPWVGLEESSPKPSDVWKGVFHPKGWKPQAPLTEAEFKSRMGKVYFPVFACGYNWLQDNADSAERLKERITEIESRLSTSSYFQYSNKVILVTHSMGGLVARKAVQDLGDKVLGVFHSVQPVTGAPAVYRRFRAGTEVDGLFDFSGAGAAVVLGWDAADVTCVLANAVGPLELLPTQDYPAEWLHITDGEKTIKMPAQGESPYKSIYSVSSTDKWWGMVTPELIDPANIYISKKPNMDIFKDHFLSLMNDAEEFHSSIQLNAHACTYANYGNDPSQRSFETVKWRTTQDIANCSESDILSATTTHKKLTGRVEVKIHEKRVSFYPDNKNEPGDGTVPAPSGKAVGKLTGIQEVFELTGFDHQHSYCDSVSQKTALYAITKIVQKLNIEADDECKNS
ncbi:esterase/lipase family protein [Azospira inquinata]|uniref:Alpha/beta hydrolase n=1 Tax=Azospira inquinata TaxID=2785627 RepID=A0A975XVX6_9RHOO|nr:hypothetical protein [Azospira inquinata]QWT47059.1 alpha/beta hydrolase [Azospira inquinata]QWT50312.1 alpha/beta hydrolase [Azospira inquinata]